MRGQQRDKHAEAHHSKVGIEEPGQQLEGVGGPAPAIGAGAQGEIWPVGTFLAHWGRTVGIPATKVHLNRQSQSYNHLYIPGGTFLISKVV